MLAIQMASSVSGCCYKLLIHPIQLYRCESCINRLFLSGPAPCPICKVTLRKSNFVSQTFDDLYVEKEIQIRKKVGRYFNKRLEDFAGNLRLYNDYLEEVEEILFNMINDVDVQQTQERIERFRLENKEIIAANIAIQRSEERAAFLLLEKEKKEKLLRKEAYLNQALEEEKAKKHEQIDIINQLASAESASDVMDIVNKSKLKMAPQKGLRFADVHIDLNMDNEDDTTVYDVLLDDGTYEPFDGLYCEPIYYAASINYTDPMAQQFKVEGKAIQLKAGGYSASIAQQRALSSAYAGIFVNLPN
ncbi:TFIIH/NER complex subunit, variant 2 [Batrachochytrium dendrobatidis]|nr:TFIIH/NER complex subunit, variant 2 [Batrachochytrium dendrobatidis]KAK5667789.1 TFIIH/NER complex subunit, variant 2 [Batrachochytrium dendrobatidis]